MSQIRPLVCPNCAAKVTVPPGATRATCEYCGSKFSIQLDHGEAVLSSNQQLAAAIQGQGQRTVEGLERLQLTQERAQLSQQLSSIQVHRDNLRSELRSLERMTQNRKIRKHIDELEIRIAELEDEQDSLYAEIDEIDATLYPAKALSSVTGVTSGVSTPLPKWRRILSGTVSAITFFLILIILSSILISTFKITAGAHLLLCGGLLPIVALVFGFYFGYYPELRKKLVDRFRSMLGRH